VAAGVGCLQEAARLLRVLLAADAAAAGPTYEALGLVASSYEARAARLQEDVAAGAVPSAPSAEEAATAAAAAAESAAARHFAAMSEARARERKKQAEGQHAAPSSVQQLSLEQVRLASAAAEFEASWRACGLRVHKARERVRGMAGRMLAVDDAVAAAGAAPTGRPRPAGPDGASLGESFFVVPSGARAQAGRPSSKAADEAAPPGPAETARRGLALVALVRQQRRQHQLKLQQQQQQPQAAAAAVEHQTSSAALQPPATAPATTSTTSTDTLLNALEAACLENQSLMEAAARAGADAQRLSDGRVRSALQRMEAECGALSGAVLAQWVALAQARDAWAGCAAAAPHASAEPVLPMPASPAESTFSLLQKLQEDLHEKDAQIEKFRTFYRSVREDTEKRRRSDASDSAGAVGAVDGVPVTPRTSGPPPPVSPFFSSNPPSSSSSSTAAATSARPAQFASRD
jgi:hypothetical protein